MIVFFSRLYQNYIVLFDVKITLFAFIKNYIYFLFIRISKNAATKCFCNCLFYIIIFFLYFPIFHFCSSLFYTSQNILVFRRHVDVKSTFLSGASFHVHEKYLCLILFVFFSLFCLFCFFKMPCRQSTFFSQVSTYLCVVYPSHFDVEIHFSLWGHP